MDTEVSLREETHNKWSILFLSLFFFDDGNIEGTVVGGVYLLGIFQWKTSGAGVCFPLTQCNIEWSWYVHIIASYSKQELTLNVTFLSSKATNTLIQLFLSTILFSVWCRVLVQEISRV